MPLVAHNDLPTFKRLSEEGQRILSPNFAQKQDIRELHIGLLNMMPDSALEATERQFFRLVGACNQIAQFHVHPFFIEGIERCSEAKAYLAKHYESFDQIKHDGLDALIISGANITQAQLPDESFWPYLTEVFDWAKQNVTSTICSCLATHALIEYCHGIKRTHLGEKRWGVFSHSVIQRTHPLVSDINTRFDVPHSRFNEVFRSDIEAAGLRVLVESEMAGVHLATSSDGFRVIYFQGHPEYDNISLLKEYKREVLRFIHAESDQYPPYPKDYFGEKTLQLLDIYKQRVISAAIIDRPGFEFPESEIIQSLDITWHDTTKAVFNNWLGRVYQVTHQDRRIPFMDTVDPNNPLGL